MKRHLYTQGFIAPPHTFVGDVYRMRFVNVECEVVLVDGENISYMITKGDYGNRTTCLAKEFYDKFEFVCRGDEPGKCYPDHDSDGFDGKDEYAEEAFGRFYPEDDYFEMSMDEAEKWEGKNPIRRSK